MANRDGENVPQFLIALLLLVGCASAPTKAFENVGAPNATLVYSASGGFLAVKTAALRIFAADEQCRWTDLGVLKVKPEQALALPTERLLQIDVRLGEQAVFSSYAEGGSIFYRFRAKAGEQYQLELTHGGRAYGFQVYRVQGNGRTEVPYEPLSTCATGP